MLSSLAIIVAVVLAIVLLLALKSFGINQEYERGVVFRLGRLRATKGPGWFWLIPLVERVVKVDIRTITYALETQETVTRDGVAVRVNAVLLRGGWVRRRRSERRAGRRFVAAVALRLTVAATGRSGARVLQEFTRCSPPPPTTAFGS